MKQSIALSSPMGTIAKKKWAAFSQWLSPKDREKLDQAMEWYRTRYLETSDSE